VLAGIREGFERQTVIDCRWLRRLDVDQERHDALARRGWPLCADLLARWGVGEVQASDGTDLHQFPVKLPRGRVRKTRRGRPTDRRSSSPSSRRSQRDLHRERWRNRPPPGHGGRRPPDARLGPGTSL